MHCKKPPPRNATEHLKYSDPSVREAVAEEETHKDTIVVMVAVEMAVDTAEVVVEVDMVDANTDPLGTQRLLLLEDNPLFAKALIKYLGQQHYRIDWARHGEEALDLSYDNRYLLYLLDINVPQLNGVDLLRSLREAGDITPAIIISAQVDTHSVTQGFIAGADDYLKKPFDPEELLVRIKAKTHTLRTLKEVGSLTIDLEEETLYKEGIPYHLPLVQKRLLLSLVRNHPNPVSKEELLLLLEKPTDLALRVGIAKMKKTLSLEIKNIRGVGYQII